MPAFSELNPRDLVQTVFDRALIRQHPLAKANVERLRRVHPDKDPSELLSLATRFYLGVITTSGAGAGAAAIVPNLAVQVPAGLGEALAFFEASVLYVLTVAEIYEVDVEDVEKRRLLVMAALAGDATSEAILKPILSRSVPHWGKSAVKQIPMSAIHKANKVLGPRFIAKWSGKTSVLILGKQVPFLIGVGVGAVGNHIFGRSIVFTTRRILGPPPSTWPDLGEERTPLV